jgi:RNA polymerase sigma-70 factor (ECF subfamily)
MTELHELPTLEEALGVGDLLDERQRHETLAEALASLPERCREVVQLRFQENLSYKEIAERLGVTTDTVKVQLGRGVRRCAKFFASRDLLQNGKTMKKAAS